MMKTTTRFVLAALFGLLFIGSGIAQNQDRDAVRAAAGSLYVVSAKAGGVNFVEGGSNGQSCRRYIRSIGQRGYS